MYSTAIKLDILKERNKFIAKNKKFTLIPSLTESKTIINQILQENDKIEDEQWPKIRADLMSFLDIAEENLDTKIFYLCFYYKKYDIAKSYFKFLESNKYELKFNTYGQYIKSFSLQNSPINEEEEKEILRTYKNLRQKYNLLDKNTCSDCIATLSLTKSWKESILLLRMIEIAYKCAGVNETAMVINACLKNNEIELAWKLIHETVLKITLRQDIYIQYFDYCKRNFQNSTIIKELEKIFMFWREHNIYPLYNVIYTYADLYKSFGYSLTDTTITNK
jgi:hypothetical protein